MCPRRYVISQILDLQQKEPDSLARHVGHDIQVQSKYYRLHESTRELTKGSKILSVVDEGNVLQECREIFQRA